MQRQTPRHDRHVCRQRGTCGSSGSSAKQAAASHPRGRVHRALTARASHAMSALAAGRAQGAARGSCARSGSVTSGVGGSGGSARRAGAGDGAATGALSGSACAAAALALRCLCRTCAPSATPVRSPCVFGHVRLAVPAGPEPAEGCPLETPAVPSRGGRVWHWRCLHRPSRLATCWRNICPRPEYGGRPAQHAQRADALPLLQ